MKEILAPLYGGGFSTESGDVLPFVLPGELVEDGADGGFQVLRPANARRAPECAHFAVCGGCHYQHATYDQQVLWKTEVLAGLLHEAGVEAPAPEVVAGEEWGYRNRIRLRLQVVENSVRVGYSRRGTHVFLPIVMCPIASGLLWRAAAALEALAAADPMCRRWLESASEVELFASAAEDRLQMQLIYISADPGSNGFEAFCRRVQGAVPELVGAGTAPAADSARRNRRRWEGAVWGAAGLAYEVEERAYWVSRGAFFQTNRFLIASLLERVCEQRSGILAWDLFAGVGLFSRVLAERFERVVAVEGGEIAAADLQAASRGGKGRPAFEARQAATLDFLRAEERQRERPQLVVLDPPRAGLGAEAAAVLGRIGPAAIVYVSCDPTTLARDLAVLVRAGYRVERLWLVDLFPQTFHLESVVCLVRDGAPNV